MNSSELQPAATRLFQYEMGFVGDTTISQIEYDLINTFSHADMVRSIILRAGDRLSDGTRPSPRTIEIWVIALMTGRKSHLTESKNEAAINRFKNGVKAVSELVLEQLTFNSIKRI